ncbi:MAG: YbhB/YbcL family Raf kinase inhibitor-like protein [Acetobacteraceae bacterium]
MNGVMMNGMIQRVIGTALRSLRAGDRHLAWNDAALAGVPACIHLTSPAFGDGQAIPARYAGAGVGDNVSPPLHWSGVPEAAAELVLIMQDPDAPLPRPVVHVIAAGIAPGAGGLAEGALGPSAAPGIRLGRASFGRRAYAGPRPLPGHGPHRYVFQLVALARPLALAEAPTLGPLLAALQDDAIARGRLIGTFEQR